MTDTKQTAPQTLWKHSVYFTDEKWGWKSEPFLFTMAQVNQMKIAGKRISAAHPDSKVKPGQEIKPNEKLWNPELFEQTLNR